MEFKSTILLSIHSASLSGLSGIELKGFKRPRRGIALFGRTSLIGMRECEKRL
jgi:hypothetical protein